MIRAVIFDLDGVLVNSEQVWNRMNSGFLAEHGIHVEPQQLYDTIGGSMDWNYRVLLRFFPEGFMTMGRLRSEYERYASQIKVDWRSILDPDAVNLLKKLRDKGIKTAIASASSMPYIEEVVRTCELEGSFDQIISGESFIRNKPWPDVYEVSVERMGLDRKECLVVEDSNLGIQAAKSAGVAVIGVKGWGQQDLQKADYQSSALAGVWDRVIYENEKHRLIRLTYQDKEIVLIPTAHVSKDSAEFARTALRLEKPDSICIELDQDRLDSITHKKTWEDTDINKIIKEHRTGYFLVNLLLASYQKRVAGSLNSQSGAEMMAGIEESKAQHVPLVLADRSVSTTFTRIWRSMNARDKIRFFTGIVSSIFSDEKIDEEELSKLEQKDELTAALNEVQEQFPEISRVLVTERDQYLARKIREAPGHKVVAVLGAAHTLGIQDWIHRDDYTLEQLDTIPPKSRGGKWILYGISLALILLVVFTFRANPDQGRQQIVNWILWHGILSAVGCVIPLGHPLTILTGFLAAPLSALSPVLASGWFAGLVEAKIRKPTVRDFSNLSTDAASWHGLVHNKVTRILLIVILSNVGSSIATFASGIDIIARFTRVLH